MPVGAGSIKRAAKKAANLEEVKEAKEVKAEAAQNDVKPEETAEVKKPAAKKTAARKTGTRKTSAKKAAEMVSEAPAAPEVKAEVPAAKAEEAAAEVPAAKAEKPAAEVPAEAAAPAEEPEGVRSMRGGALIANQSDILGENKKVEVLQEMPVYLL